MEAKVREVRTDDHYAHRDTDGATYKTVPLDRKFCITSLKDWDVEIVVDAEVYQANDESSVDD